MVNITITSDQISYIDSVLGQTNYGYNRESIEMVDAVSVHIETDKGWCLYNVQQYSFNNQTFSTSTEAISFINNL
jgi:hypothetical protein